MFRFYRTARVKNSQKLFVEAVQWAKELAEYMNSTYSLSMQVYTEILGDSRSIYWYIDHKSLAAVEEFGVKLLSDQKYSAMVDKGADFFIEGTFRDKIMRLV